MKRFDGMGLPEMMISLLLSSLISIALLQYFIGVKQQYHMLETQLDVTNQTQWVVDLLRNSIRQAGFTPCLRIDKLVAIDHRQIDPNVTFISTQEGLLSAYMSPYFDEVIDVINATQLLATRTQAVRLDYPVLIADCYHAEVVTVKAVQSLANQQTITLNTPLLFDYQPPVFVGEWVEEQFWVKNNRLLYRYHHTDELTHVVQTMFVDMNRSLIDVTLGQADGRKVRVTTRIRSR